MPVRVIAGIEKLLSGSVEIANGESVVEVGAFVSGVAVPAVQVENEGPLLIDPLGSPTQQITPLTSSLLLLKRSPEGLIMLPGQQ